MIGLEGLSLFPRIGVTAEERERPREMIIDLRLTLDISRAAATDALEDTVDYGAVAQLLSGSVEKGEFLLIERLAGHIVELLLKGFPVEAVWVRVSKPGVAKSRAAFCELEGRR
jgi:7,8-dihydroneopterin aldolase/epimerase/oxygenase